MARRVILLLFGLFVVFGCKDRAAEKYGAVPLETKKVELTSSKIHSGKKLMENQCHLCHSPTASEKEGRIGPPMVAIKAHYIDESTTKEAFIQSIWSFLEQPSEENAKLRGAVRRFGVMPYQSFKKEDIEQIGEYLYEYEIEEPSWFKKHWENNPNRKPYINKGKKIYSNDTLSKEDIGLEYALSTKKILGKNLMGTIQKKGTLEALAFCNERAYPLTDSMAYTHKALIKRVSDKPRNPKNLANAIELEKIEYYKRVLASGESIIPIVESQDEVNHFYYPIVTNSMCLQCHGVPKQQIKPEVLTVLKDLYPKDMAQGYDVNQVRGIWSIVFEE
ncbi:DUF3365 domain-containing protein [Flagellimonas sp. 389]|uniref:Tll0287-like domain-containing protein n=1 Tax=Flagellimonas sp. 389 TaxID=2835862 RepID=UPI001BD29AD2|nr:DUF3365 domain-containing protein [Flagellimonas sp. 389]MBS9462598.1 DUF3365 domain-containing protein [Flagellimonas sp. 389]